VGHGNVATALSDVGAGEVLFGIQGISVHQSRKQQAQEKLGGQSVGSERFGQLNCLTRRL
jgi:hypothetical protein